MKFGLKLTATVHRDLSDARLWYSQQSPGLEDRLGISFYSALEKICAAPRPKPVATPITANAA
jgi:hypothetical protein